MHMHIYVYVCMMPKEWHQKLPCDLHVYLHIPGYPPPPPTHTQRNSREGASGDRLARCLKGSHSVSTSTVLDLWARQPPLAMQRTNSKENGAAMPRDSRERSNRTWHASLHIPQRPGVSVSCPCIINIILSLAGTFVVLKIEPCPC